MGSDVSNNDVGGLNAVSVTSESGGVYSRVKTHNAVPLTRRARNIKIIEDVCAIHGVAYRELMSHDRRHKVVDARHEAIALIAKHNPDFSFPRIGKIFNRDHTTVMFALQRHGMTRKDGLPFAKVQGPSRALKKGVFTTTTEGENAHENS